MPILLKRTLSTLVLWAIVFSLLYYLGATGAVWLVALMTALTLHEFDALLRHSGCRPFGKLNILLGAAIILVPWYLPRLAAGASAAAAAGCAFGTAVTGATAAAMIDTADLLALGVIIASVRIIAERDSSNRVETLAATLFGLVYVPLMFQFFVRVIAAHTGAPHSYTGVLFFLWIIIASKLCDTGALLTGLAVGKHKMTPVISPKKTWEGAAGGLLAAALISAAFAALFRAWLPAGFTPLFAALAALPVAALGIVADLVESIIKRRAGIKDSGAAIPGIGGMFDVTDSLILTAPAAYWLLKLM
ncbi:MAG: phosphatidate cytidylyltransferase [Opitutaceae bacterium]|nr:phosphatidate cytidylyltransferase [Opitutaceae bacterium]